jgi:hypothetical protein
MSHDCLKITIPVMSPHSRRVKFDSCSGRPPHLAVRLVRAVLLLRCPTQSLERSALEGREPVAGGEPPSGAAPGKRRSRNEPRQGRQRGCKINHRKAPILSPLPGLRIVVGLTPGSAAARLARGY